MMVHARGYYLTKYLSDDFIPIDCTYDVIVPVRFLKTLTNEIQFANGTQLTCSLAFCPLNGTLI